MGSTADGAAQRYPVSVKGVVIDGGRVALLKNERDEWELPGGKLELRENPRSCVEREIFEEPGWAVQVEKILDCYRIYQVVAWRDRAVMALIAASSSRHYCRFRSGQARVPLAHRER
jgi:8-oxo-dGTP pyrophosphatase MutT (NUDIX family)